MKKDIWLDGNRCGVCISFDVDAEYVVLGHKPETANMPARLSLGKYVWRGKVIYRIMDLLDKYNVKATFFVPGINALNHPDVMRDIHNRGHEVACHGWKHEDISNMPRDEEERRLLMQVEAIEKATGVRPVGYRNSSELSPNTQDLLWENGFIYESCLMDSDLPYRHKAPESDEYGLVEIPSYYEMDDFHQFADFPGTQYRARMHSPEAGYEIWTNAFDGYYKFGLLYVTMFHPQIIGKPGMIMLFDRLLNYIKKFPDVWFATAEEVSRHWINIEN